MKTRWWRDEIRGASDSHARDCQNSANEANQAFENSAEETGRGRPDASAAASLDWRPVPFLLALPGCVGIGLGSEGKQRRNSVLLRLLSQKLSPEILVVVAHALSLMNKERINAILFTVTRKSITT
jgi:hypothetical protein